MNRTRKEVNKILEGFLLLTPLEKFHIVEKLKEEKTYRKLIEEIEPTINIEKFLENKNYTELLENVNLIDYSNNQPSVKFKNLLNNKKEKYDNMCCLLEKTNSFLEFLVYSKANIIPEIRNIKIQLEYIKEEKIRESVIQYIESLTEFGSYLIDLLRDKNQR